MADEYVMESPDDSAWKEFFADDIDRERWQTNFGKDSDSAEEAAYWRDMVPGIEPSVAAIYKKQGLNVYDVGNYHTAGISDYKEILGWHGVGAQPEVALAFREKGVKPEIYAKWSKIGVQDPDTMIRFSEDYKLDLNQLEKYVRPLLDNQTLELADVPKWLEAGVALQELQNWLDAGFKYPSLVKAWKSLRMKPTDAKKWEEVVIYPREAARWIGAGYKNVEDVSGLIKQGYHSPEEIDAEAENLVVKG